MKQRITVKQLTELTHEQKLKLHAQWNPQKGDFYAWYKSKGSVDKVSYLVRDTNEPFDDPEAKLLALPLLSIGQMIELLGNKIDYMASPYGKEAHIENGQWKVWMVGGGFWDGETEELCDALWDAVKEEVLN